MFSLCRIVFVLDIVLILSTLQINWCQTYDRSLLTTITQFHLQNKASNLFVISNVEDGNLSASQNEIVFYNENLFTDLLAVSYLRTQSPVSLILNFSDYRIFRPSNNINLYTYIINDHQNFQDLIILTQKKRIHDSILFLIFKNTIDPVTLRICENPTSNYFNLRFDSKMFVQCSKNPMINEWYSINEIEIRVLNYAVWSADNELQRLGNLLSQERYNLNGHPLRIMVSTFFHVK